AQEAQEALVRASTLKPADRHLDRPPVIVAWIRLLLQARPRVWKNQRFGLTAEDACDPRVMIDRLGRAPVEGCNCRRQGLMSLVRLTLLVLRHRQDEAGTGRHDRGGFAGHQLDGIVEPTLAIPRQ